MKRVTSKTYRKFPVEGAAADSKGGPGRFSGTRQDHRSARGLRQLQCSVVKFRPGRHTGWHYAYLRPLADRDLGAPAGGDGA